MGGGPSAPLIQASLELSKAKIAADQAKFQAILEHKSAKDQEETKRVSALFTLVGETNKDTLNTLVELNKGVQSLYAELTKAHSLQLQQYTELLKSLGNNISSQSASYAEMLKNAAGLDKDVQKTGLEFGREIIRDIKDALVKCFETITKLIEKADGRFAKQAHDIMRNLEKANVVLQQLATNNNLYMTQTLAIMQKYGNKW